MTAHRISGIKRRSVPMFKYLIGRTPNENLPLELLIISPLASSSKLPGNSAMPLTPLGPAHVNGKNIKF